MEEWKQITDFPNYAISNIGRVKRINPGRGTRVEKVKILFPHPQDGRLSVGLCRDNKRYTVKIHTLVAKYFIGDRPIGLEINHKNGICTDNRSDNLEYITPLENKRHCYSNFLSNKLTETDVIDILKLISNGIKAKIIAEKYNIHECSVYRIKNRKSWKFASPSLPVERRLSGDREALAVNR